MVIFSGEKGSRGEIQTYPGDPGQKGEKGLTGNPGAEGETDPLVFTLCVDHLKNVKTPVNRFNPSLLQFCVDMLHILKWIVGLK